MSASNWILQAEILEAGAVKATLEFDDGKIKVGKLSTSQIHLDDNSVSHIHAVLENQGDGTFQVIDLGSATGTYVNGQKVTKAVARSGDELRFGEVSIRIQVANKAELEAERQRQAAAAAAAAAQPVVPENCIELEDGTVVEPFTMEGYYDDSGNYIPGYYDEAGEYHYGYGYYDDQGAWQVAHGYYDAAGEWVPTAAPDEVERRSDTEVYTENFFQGDSGDVLEIAFLWSDHVLNVQSFREPKSVMIGEDGTNDYVIEDPILGQRPQFPLITFVEGQGYRLNFLPQMQGMVQKDGQQLSLEEAIARGVAAPDGQGSFSMPLLKGTSVRVDFGPNTFLIHFTRMPVLAAGAFAVEKAPVFYLGVSLALHVAFMLLVFMLPDNFGGFELHDFNANDRFVELLTPPEQEEEDDLEFLEEDAETAAAADDAGEAGEEEAPDEDLAMAVEGEVDPEDVELQRERDMEIASEAGALAVFNDMPFGAADDPLGGDALSALGNLTADHAGAARGVGGLGLTDAGRGGGGDVEGGLGMAQVGTRGMGRGQGENPGANLGDREVREPIIVPGEPAVTGSLDREIIQRVVRQHRREMVHCYETELRRNPNLEGRVVMTWVIAANGSVVSSSVQETTLNNRNVENCMAQRIRRWVFPEPDGGGIVRVNYPFNFSS